MKSAGMEREGGPPHGAIRFRIKVVAWRRIACATTFFCWDAAFAVRNRTDVNSPTGERPHYFSFASIAVASSRITKMP